MNKLKTFIIFCLMSMLSAGCSPWEGYKETVRDGIKTIPHVREIENIFSDTPMDHFFIEYGVHKDEPTTWNTVVYFGGRYTLTYVVRVQIDFQKHRVIKTVSPPMFYLVEVKKITIHPKGSVESDNESGYQFGEKEWGKIVAANGDFSAIGIQLITNSPLPGFDKYIESWRVGRMHVEQ